jgi:peptide/nickel transport system permease protein
MAEAAREVILNDLEYKRRSLLFDAFIRLLKEKPLGVIGAVIVIGMLFVGIFANYLAPTGYNEMRLASRLDAPSKENLLGADHLGRDLLSRIIYGARISMYVSLGVSSLSILIATMIGTVSGFLGGRVDIVIQRFVDGWMCIPGLFLILTIMAVVGPGLLQVIFVLGVLSGVGGSRVIRSAVIAVKENQYVYASRAVGARTGTIIFRHILPNVMGPVIISFTVTMGGAIIAEASISFLGFGIPPPAPSWGGMLSEGGRRYMLQAPWMALWPGLALSLVVYGINMLGDALRDILDPRLRGRLGRYGRGKDIQASRRGMVRRVFQTGGS